MHQARKLISLPDNEGYYGEYGGRFVPEALERILDEVTNAYLDARDDPEFERELQSLYRHYVGRPSPVFFSQHLTRHVGGAKIYFKREDLNHTGAHKINHSLGQALLAKRMGKTRIIAETAAGQHGVALATAAAIVGLECEIYMGEVDIVKEHPNVVRMQILGTKVIPVSTGFKSLKDALDAAFEAYLKDPLSQFYAIGSAVGPYPFPMMIRDFQEIIGEEAREQFTEMTGRLPDHLVACVGGGSNAIGLFSAFLDDPDIRMYGVEPAGRGFGDGDHAASLTKGSPGILHGFRSYLLQDAEGRPLPVHSIASGLDYPGVGPEHAHLKDINRVEYRTINDREAVDAFFTLSRVEGIIPALESAHAVAFAVQLASEIDKRDTILVNLSGRGDKDIDFIAANFGREYGLGTTERPFKLGPCC